jgi:hypothetical protein
MFPFRLSMSVHGDGGVVCMGEDAKEDTSIGRFARTAIVRDTALAGGDRQARRERRIVETGEDVQFGSSRRYT